MAASCISMPASSMCSGATQEVPEDGIIQTDDSLRLIASDSRAAAILNDVREHEGADGLRLGIPREISDALLGRTPEDWAGIRVGFFGRRHSYHCTIYQVESRNGVPKQKVIMFHLQRDASPNGAILQIVSRCGLTPREEAVLRGISIGLTTKEIAQRLNISPNTVKTYLRAIMLKLGVTTRAAIVGKLLTCEEVPQHNGEVRRRREG
jgi:DNA-binding CsgD family transcriptional regulator